MHRGRLFPQSIHRWACPDFPINQWAPLTALIRVHAEYDIISINNLWEAPLTVFDKPTGVFTFVLPDTVIMGQTFGGFFFINCVHPPAHRYWAIRLHSGSQVLQAQLTLADLPGGFSIPVNSAPAFIYHPTTVDPPWDGFIRVSVAGKPYF